MSDLEDESLSSGSNTPPNQQELPEDQVAGLGLVGLGCLEGLFFFLGGGRISRFENLVGKAISFYNSCSSTWHGF